MAETEDKVTIDYEEIRKWAEAVGGKPVLLGEGDAATIDFGFPHAPKAGAQEISWKEFFTRFEEKRLALAYGEDEGRPYCSFVERRGLDELADRPDPY